MSKSNIKIIVLILNIAFASQAYAEEAFFSSSSVDKNIAPEVENKLILLFGKKEQIKAFTTTRENLLSNDTPSESSAYYNLYFSAVNAMSAALWGSNYNLSKDSSKSDILKRIEDIERVLTHDGTFVPK